jgi:hypothetical protein
VVIFLPENSTREVKMVPVEFIIKEGDENLTSHSGMALTGALINRMGLAQTVDSIVLPGCQEPRISTAIF